MLHHIKVNDGPGKQWNLGFLFGCAHCAGVDFDNFNFGYDSPKAAAKHKVSNIAKIDCNDSVFSALVKSLNWRYEGYTNEVEILD